MSSGTILPKEKSQEIKISGKFKLVLGIGIFLTGVCFIFLLGTLTLGGINMLWSSPQAYFVAKTLLFLFTMSMVCIGLCIIAFKKNPFSATISMLGRIVGIIWIVVSFILPRMEGFVGSFVIFSNGKGALMDGETLITGIILIIFSYILHYGYQYQKIQDEII